MKKWLSVLLVLVLLLNSVSAMASCYSMDTVKDYPEIYTVTEDLSEEVAFIDNDDMMKASERSFVHPYESDQYYSSFDNDIVVVNYGKSDQYAVWRLWIYYYGKQAIKADAVTFHFQGKDYRFSGVYDSDNISTKDNGDAYQCIMIKYGTDNLKFAAALESYVESVGDLSEFNDAYTAGKGFEPITMTLHGSEDITVSLPDSFYMNFYLMKIAFVLGGGDFDDAIEPTTLTVN